jgi:ATP synthase I chain
VERDQTLRGVERNAFFICAAMTAAACFVQPRPAVALGVLGGGFLVGVSYWSLKSSVTALVDVLAGVGRGAGQAADGAGPRANMRREIVKLTLRYALLGLLAYVMIARLRLHPWGLLAGASSVVAGVSLEAARLLMKK